jgi:hypothetical protein
MFYRLTRTCCRTTSSPCACLREELSGEARTTTTFVMDVQPKCQRVGQVCWGCHPYTSGGVRRQRHGSDWFMGHPIPIAKIHSAPPCAGH